MSHSPAISVIIPVYNVESWLRRAVGSLQNQTCTSYEILLVDDGSTDGSGALCDKLADDDVRIRVIHQENQEPPLHATPLSKSLVAITCTSWTATTGAIAPC